MKKYIIFIFYTLLVAGCSEQTIPTGVVAMVNGSYITLNELQNRYDVQTMHISEFASPPIESFHKEYTDTLLEMVVEVALEQELKKNKIEITTEDIDKAVREIQGGYSDDEFSQMLAERYIDFESWKKQIRASVIEELYLSQVLSHNIILTDDDIKDFYIKNPSLFIVDYKIDGNIVSSQDKESVEKAVHDFEQGKTKENILATYKDINIESVHADASNIPFEHGDEVTKIALRKSTTIQHHDNRYSSIFVTGRAKGKKLALADAWNMAKSYIIMDKAKAMYPEAVGGVLKEASIHVVDEFKHAIDAMIGKESIAIQQVAQDSQEGVK